MWRGREGAKRNIHRCVKGTSAGLIVKFETAEATPSAESATNTTELRIFAVVEREKW